MKTTLDETDIHEPGWKLFDEEYLTDLLRRTIRHELDLFKANLFAAKGITPPAMTEMPMYKMSELCQIFRVSKPTLYEWIRKGELRPIKIRSRVFFLSSDIKNLIASKRTL